MGRRQTDGGTEAVRLKYFGMRRKGAKKGETAMRPMAENVKPLDRQSHWHHLLHSWLAQSKPGWSAQACTRQAQSEIDGARRRVWPEP